MSGRQHTDTFSGQAASASSEQGFWNWGQGRNSNRQRMAEETTVTRRQDDSAASGRRPVRMARRPRSEAETQGGMVARYATVKGRHEPG
jgi:hypothetical protein